MSTFFANKKDYQRAGSGTFGGPDIEGLAGEDGPTFYTACGDRLRCDCHQRRARVCHGQQGEEQDL
jgi:hypothetical protein